MNDTHENRNARPDVAWGQITRKGTSSSFIENQLTDLLGDTGAVEQIGDRVRVDVIHIDNSEAR